MGAQIPISQIIGKEPKKNSIPKRPALNSFCYIVFFVI